MALPMLLVATAFSVLIIANGDRSPTSERLSSLFRRAARQDRTRNPNNLQSILSRATQDDGVVNPSLLLRQIMVDPLPVPNFNISTSSSFTNIDGHFRKQNLHGLRGTRISRIQLNLGQANATVLMTNPGLRLDGLYALQGNLAIVSVDSQGDFWMNMTGVTAYGETTLRKDARGNVQVDEVKVEIEVNDFQLHFDNLLGSWSSFSNSLLNQMSENIYEQIRSSMVTELKKAIRNELDSRLKEIPDGFLESNTTNVFDSLLERASETMADSGFDPIILPEYEDTFHRKAFFLKIYGQIKAHNGSLYGLSTLHRTGDIAVVYENDSLIFEASVGFRNLTGAYNWNAHFMGVGPMGTMALTLSHTSIFMRLRQELKKGSHPKLLDLELDRIGQVWIDVQGLGSLDYLLEIVVNLMTNALKHSIAGAIIPPVRESIQSQLNEMPVNI